MTYTITIEADNAAFGEDDVECREEMARVLRDPELTITL